MIVVLLTLAAAALSAVSAAGEHRAASRIAKRRRQTRRRVFAWAGFALALASSPLWLASWTMDIGAFFVQAAALHLGSLTVVQPLMVSTLLFTLPLAAVGVRRWPGVRDWVGAVAVTAGLALVLSTRRSPDGPETSTPALLPALASILAGVVVLLAVSRRRSPSVRAALFAIAAGGLFGVGAALTKLAAAVAVNGGVVGLLTTWSGYALAVVSLASFSLQQGAYAIGRLATIMTAVIIVDPLTSYFLGVVGFGEPLPSTGTALIISVLAMLMLAVGVAVLARSPLFRDQMAAVTPTETGSAEPSGAVATNYATTDEPTTPSQDR